MPVDPIVISDIQSDIERIERILGTYIFYLENRKHPLRFAAFTELMVCLNDLLQKAKDLGVPVSFDDDVQQNIKTKGGATPNITDLVNALRNAICHISSPLNLIPNEIGATIKQVFFVGYGKFEPVFYVRDKPVGQSSKYEDEITIAYGDIQIYYFRHIHRAYKEAKENLLPFLP